MLTVGSVVEFEHTDSPVPIPEGHYVGCVVDTDFVLGSNSMDREWCTVEVVSGGDLHGRCLTIYQQHTA